MATVSVIVSAVLTGCSYGNNVCNSGFGANKALADARRGGAPPPPPPPREGVVDMYAVVDFDFNERARALTEKVRWSGAHVGLIRSRQTGNPLHLDGEGGME